VSEAPDSSEESFEAPAMLAEDAILFPEMEVAISARDTRNVAAAAQAFRENNLVVMIPAPGPEGASGSIGTLVLLRNMLPTRGGATQWLAKGLWRVRIENVLEESPYVRVRFVRAGGIEDVPPDRSKAMTRVFTQIDEFVKLMPGIPPEIISFLKSVDTPGKLADVCAYSPFFTFEERLDLLKTLDAEERLGKVSALFEKQLGELKKASKVITISECATCIDLADKAFELGPNRSAGVAREFLDHVVREHPEELLALLAERYGPEFLRRRALK
jgi:ATP-dependent Lon protease